MNETTNDMYAPKAENNPWRLNDMKTPEEWLQLALWYPFSIRSLIFDGRWSEHCRCSNLHEAKFIMRLLAKEQASALDCYIVVQCFRYGKQGREKMILSSPSEQMIRVSLAKSKERT